MLAKEVSRRMTMRVKVNDEDGGGLEKVIGVWGLSR